MFQTSIRLEDVTINPEYEAMVPPHSKEKYEELKQSISENGLYEDIIINEQNQVLDGHHRLRACKDVNVIPRFQVRRFESKDEEMIYVIETNLTRRQLQVFQEVELRLSVERIKAKQRQIELGKTHGKHPLESNDSKGRVREVISEKLTTTASPKTVQRAIYVIDHAPDEIKEMARLGNNRGGWSISKAYSETKKAVEPETKTPPLPDDQFNVIYADPPWKYGFTMTYSRDITNHYPVMELEEIKNLKIPSAKDSILLLWTTVTKLEESIEVLNAWGFTYKTHMIWVKDKIGMGYWFRGKHELLLLGIKGNFKTPDSSVLKPSVLEAPRKEHSAKPHEVYEIIESYFPNGKYLELFSRNKRDNWVMWGNEVE